MNRKIEKKCIIFGGLGNPNHSVISLYATHIVKLQEFTDFICVDTIVESADEEFINNRINDIKNILGIKYKQIISPSEFFNSLDDIIENIKSVLILTPVATHFDILKRFSDSKNVLFVIEKPSCSFNDLNNGFFKFIENLKDNNNMFYLIDTMLVANSLDYFIDNNYLKYLGKIKSINAICVDNPWDIEDSLHNFKFNNKISAINDRGLLDKFKSGGAGIGLDMGIHAIAALTKFLDKINLNIQNITIDEVLLEALDINYLNRDDGMETYLLSKAKIDDIDIIIEGGKGSNIWDRRLEIYGENEIIVIGFGSLKFKNYIVRIKNDKLVELTVFDNTDTGYSNHIKDIYNLTLNKKQNLFITPEKSVQYMKDAMNLINNLYKNIDDNIENREPFIKKIKDGPHINSYLNDSQNNIRQILQELVIDELL